MIILRLSRILLATGALLALLLVGCAGEQLGENPATMQPEGKFMTLYVGPNLVDCTGAASQKCMQVKETLDGEYGPFYDQIEGFSYEEGYNYEIVVSVTPIENPPADGSVVKYVLVELVSRAAAAVPGGEPEVKTPQVGLEQRPWQLQGLGQANGEVASALEGTEITISFEGGNFGGNSGCNNFGGSYTIDGNNLALTVGPVTMMACEEAIMNQESAFLSALGQVVAYEISSDTLKLLAADGATLIAFNVLAPAQLTGVTWAATGYNNGQEAVSSTVAGTTITAIFGEDGNLSGSAGCNNYTASYLIEGESISIGPAASTRMMCAEPNGVMEQESAYLESLTRATAYIIQGNQLTLRAVDGATLATFVAAAPSEVSPIATPEGISIGGGTPPDADVSINPGNVAVDVQISVVPGQPYDNSQSSGPVGAPEHTAIFLDGKEVIHIFPVGEYVALWADAGDPTIGDIIALLQDILKKQPKHLNTPMPMLPPAFAFNDLAIKARYLNFHDGEGVRFVGRIAQDHDPVLNGQLNYYFQGLSADGGYFVSAIIPVSTTALPDNVESMPARQRKQAEDSFESYLKATADRLAKVEPTEFTPNLRDLDALMQSLIVGQPAGAEAPGPSPESQPGAEITGVVWQWLEMRGSDDSVLSVPDPAKYTAVFMPDGSLSVMADCNLGGGRYQVDGSSFSIEILQMTLAQCQPESLSDQFVDRLNHAASYVISDGFLVINLQMDGGDLKFAPGR